jgi:Transposase IS200 like
MAGDGDIRTGRHRVFILHVHLVFVTKYRHKVSGSAHLERMEEIMRDVCADFRAELAEFNGESGHVHLLVNFPPTVAISRLVNSLKGCPPPVAAGIPGPAAALLAGETPVVRVVLRGIGRRGTYLCPAPLHRTAGPAVLTGSCPPAFTTGLKAGALAAILVA